MLERYNKAFMRLIFNSVHVEINRQLREIHRAKKKPTLIRMGKLCSLKYAREHWCNTITSAPREHNGVEIEYNCDDIIGVVVVSKPP